MSRTLLLILALVPGVALAQTELDDGFAKSISGAAASTTTYYLDVPAGTTNLGFKLEQGTGGAYMYVNYGSASSDPGEVECQHASTCDVDPQAGRWYVQVYGVSTYSGAELTGWSLTRLQKGDSVANLAGDADSYRWFLLTVPGGTDSLTAATSGGTGNVQLALVDANTWQEILHGSGGTMCVSDDDPANAESCTRSNPRPGTWLVSIYGDSAYTGVTLHVDYEEGSGGALPPLTFGALLLALAVRTRWRRAVLAALLAAVGAGAQAAPAEGGRAIPIADFVRDPDFQGAKLSPNGLHVATARINEGRSVLQILRLKDMQPVGAFGLTGERDVEDFYWPNDESVLFGLSYRLGSIGKPVWTGELVGVNLDGSRRRTLIAPDKSNLLYFTVGRTWQIVDLLRNDPEHILVSLHYAPGEPPSGSRPYLFRLNVNSGRMTRIMQAHLRHGDFLTDHEGRVRFMAGTERDGTYVVLYRDGDDGDWTEFGRYQQDAAQMVPLKFAADNRKVYVAGNLDQSTYGIHELDLATRQQKLLYRDPVYDAYALLSGRDYRSVVGVAFEGTRTQWHFFDDKHPDAVLYSQLRKAFGDRDLFFTNYSDDGRLAIAATGSDIEPTTYFVVDLEKKALLAKLPQRPWIKAAQMSPTRPIEFKARDGLTIHGYLTLPRDRAADTNLPMIVLPHGGPHLRDYWDFDPEVQLLASRGYAVLQPNFRGSAGYGRDFEKAGKGQWGKAMLDDVIDATRWAIAQRHADASRICIYGGSFGAYTALMAAAMEPDLYRCTAGYAGVYDLSLQAESDIADYAEGRVYLESEFGTDTAEMARRSPATHAGKIKAPVFLAHGEEDRRTPLAQFKAMRAALKAANKPYEELVKPHEGHGFASEKNREELYTKLIAFFDRHTAPK